MKKYVFNKAVPCDSVVIFCSIWPETPLVGGSPAPLPSGRTGLDATLSLPAGSASTREPPAGPGACSPSPFLPFFFFFAFFDVPPPSKLWFEWKVAPFLIYRMSIYPFSTTKPDTAIPPSFGVKYAAGVQHANLAVDFDPASTTNIRDKSPERQTPHSRKSDPFIPGRISAGLGFS